MRARLTFLLFALVLLPAVALAEAPEGYPFERFDRAMRAASDDNRVLFVYFGRFGCGYCEKTNKEAFSDAGVRERYVRNYALAYVDAESGKRLRLPSGERITERELGTRYDAHVTPIFTFLTPSGKVIYKMVGVQRIEDLVEADDTIQAALAKLGTGQ